MQEIVFRSNDNQALTTSVIVAEKFGKEHYKCKDCVMFADEDADSAPYCLAKDLYTFVMGEDEACEEFEKWNGKK